MCRANGHFTSFYSVAQHCLNCAREAEARGFSPRTQLLLLLHDASEAYLSDITRPVKLGLPEYRAIEEHLQLVIYERFGLTPYTSADKEIIADIDNLLLKSEFLALAGETLDIKTGAALSPPDFGFKPFAEIEKAFLDLFYKLAAEI